MLNRNIADNAEIGKRIHNIRKNKHLKAEDLAEVLGYSNRSSVSKIETGSVDITISQLQKIAGFLSVSIEYLLGLTNNPEGMAENKVEYGITPLLVHDLPEYVNRPDITDNTLPNHTTSDLSDVISSLNETGKLPGSYIAVTNGLLFNDSTDKIEGHFAISADTSYRDLFDCIDCDQLDYLVFAKTEYFDPGDYLLITIPSHEFRGKYEFFFGLVEENTTEPRGSKGISVYNSSLGRLVTVLATKKEFPESYNTSIKIQHYYINDSNIAVIGRLEAVIQDYRTRITRARGRKIYWQNYLQEEQKNLEQEQKEYKNDQKKKAVKASKLP